MHNFSGYFIDIGNITQSRHFQWSTSEEYRWFVVVTAKNQMNTKPNKARHHCTMCWIHVFSDNWEVIVHVHGYANPIHIYAMAEPIHWLTYWGRDRMAAVFPDDIFKCILLNENIWIPVKISLKFVPKGQLNISSEDDVSPSCRSSAWLKIVNVNVCNQ